MEAVCPSSPLRRIGVFWTLPTDQFLWRGTPHLSLHACHSLFVTLSVRLSFLFTPWQEVGRFSFGSCFSYWLPGEQWSFCASAHSSTPVVQSSPVLKKVGLPCAQDINCTVAYMSSTQWKVHILDWGLQKQGVRKRCLIDRERCLYRWFREALLLDKD